MKCSLCKEREANKKNTHYLTDGIIRSCINYDASSDREKGFYFDLSNNTGYVDFNFQRETPVDKLEDSLGRTASDEEIEKAKEVPFSVDNVFCSNCEKLFTDIENEFINNILPQFRDADLSTTNELSIAENRLIRLFFYLQVWRTFICTDNFPLSSYVSEKLRNIILNYNSVDDSEIIQFPLSITYLETSGDKKEYTSNFVGHTNDRHPNLLIMNDFVIQYFESKENIRFLDFYGLNSTDDYKKFINYDESTFLIRIINNKERKQFLKNITREEKVKPTIEYYVEDFSIKWLEVFDDIPSDKIVKEYLNRIVGDDEFNVLQYTEENINKITEEFIDEKKN